MATEPKLPMDASKVNTKGTKAIMKWIIRSIAVLAEFDGHGKAVHREDDDHHEDDGEGHPAHLIVLKSGRQQLRDHTQESSETTTVPRAEPIVRI